MQGGHAVLRNARTNRVEAVPRLFLQDDPLLFPMTRATIRMAATWPDWFGATAAPPGSSLNGSAGTGPA